METATPRRKRRYNLRLHCTPWDIVDISDNGVNNKHFGYEYSI